MLRIIAALIAAVFALGTLASPVYAAGKDAPKTETKQPAKPAAPKKEPLDINSASEDQLKALPGIADAYAKKIVGPALQAQGRAGAEEDRSPGDLRQDQESDRRQAEVM